MSEKDTPPPSTPPEEPTGNPPPVEAPPEGSPPAPEPERVAEEHGEKVPAWGEALMEQVSEITDMLSAVLPEMPGTPDDTPRKEPWHKKGFK